MDNAVLFNKNNKRKTKWSQEQQNWNPQEYYIDTAAQSSSTGMDGHNFVSFECSGSVPNPPSKTCFSISQRNQFNNGGESKWAVVSSDSSDAALPF